MYMIIYNNNLNKYIFNQQLEHAWNLPSGLCSSLGESLEYGGGGDSEIWQEYDYNWNLKT